MNESLLKMFRNSSTAQQQEAYGGNLHLERGTETIKMGKEGQNIRTKYSAQVTLHSLLPDNSPEVIGMEDTMGGVAVERIQGKTLLEVARSDAEQAEHYLNELRTLVNFLHQQGFVHGDLSLANIIITRRHCHVCIIDPATWKAEPQNDLDALDHMQQKINQLKKKHK